MRIKAVLFALLCVIALPLPAPAHVLRRQSAGAVRARRGHAAFVLVHRGPQGLRRGHPAGLELRDGLLGTGRQLPRELARGSALAEGPHRGVRSPGQSAGGRRQDPARARLDRGGRRLLSRPRQDAAQHPTRRLHEGDGADDAAISRRLRGLDVLRADPAGLGAEERQDLREPAEVRGDPRATLQAESGPPGGGALPGPRL